MAGVFLPLGPLNCCPPPPPPLKNTRPPIPAQWMTILGVDDASQLTAALVEAKVVVAPGRIFHARWVGCNEK